MTVMELHIAWFVHVNVIVLNEMHAPYTVVDGSKYKSTGFDS